MKESMKDLTIHRSMLDVTMEEADVNASSLLLLFGFAA